MERTAKLGAKPVKRHIHPNMRFDILPGELPKDPVRYWIHVWLLYLTVFDYISSLQEILLV